MWIEVENGIKLSFLLENSFKAGQKVNIGYWMDFDASCYVS